MQFLIHTFFRFAVFSFHHLFVQHYFRTSIFRTSVFRTYTQFPCFFSLNHSVRGWASRLGSRLERLWLILVWLWAKLYGLDSVYGSNIGSIRLGSVRSTYGLSTVQFGDNVLVPRWVVPHFLLFSWRVVIVLHLTSYEQDCGHWPLQTLSRKPSVTCVSDTIHCSGCVVPDSHLSWNTHERLAPGAVG